jgi:hypothetical protein
MTAWPTLSRAPVLGGLTEVTENDLITEEGETGPDLTRIKATRPYLEFNLSYVALTSTDVAALRSFWTSYRAEFVDWTHPDATTWHVRQKAPAEIAANAVVDGLYDVRVTLRGYPAP